MSRFDAAMSRADRIIRDRFADRGYTVRVGVGAPHDVILSFGTRFGGDLGTTPFPETTICTFTEQVESHVGDVVVVGALAYKLDALLMDDGRMREFIALTAQVPG